MAWYDVFKDPVGYIGDWLTPDVDVPDMPEIDTKAWQKLESQVMGMASHGAAALRNVRMSPEFTRSTLQGIRQARKSAIADVDTYVKRSTSGVGGSTPGYARALKNKLIESAVKESVAQQGKARTQLAQLGAQIETQAQRDYAQAVLQNARLLGQIKMAFMQEKLQREMTLFRAKMQAALAEHDAILEALKMAGLAAGRAIFGGAELSGGTEAADKSFLDVKPEEARNYIKR